MVIITSYPTRANGIIVLVNFAADFYFDHYRGLKLKTSCGKFFNLAHYFPYDVKLRLLALSADRFDKSCKQNKLKWNPQCPYSFQTNKPLPFLSSNNPEYQDDSWCSFCLISSLILFGTTNFSPFSPKPSWTDSSYSKMEIALDTEWNYPFSVWPSSGLLNSGKALRADWYKIQCIKTSCSIGDLTSTVRKTSSFEHLTWPCGRYALLSVSARWRRVPFLYSTSKSKFWKSSPAQRLFGRRTRTLVTTASRLLVSIWKYWKLFRATISSVLKHHSDVNFSWSIYY